MIADLVLASWWARTREPATESRSELAVLLGKCREILAILARFELLSPARVVLAGGTRPDIELPVTLDDLEAIVLAEVARNPDLVHVELSIHGPGRIVESSGVDWILDDLVVVNGCQFDGQLISVDVFGDACKRRLHVPNAEQPPGLFFGHVSDELFDTIVPYIGLPTPDEGFHVVPVDRFLVRRGS